MVEVSDREHSRQLKSLLEQNFHVTFCNSAVNINEWWAIGWSVEPIASEQLDLLAVVFFLTTANIAKKKKKMEREKNKHKKKLDMMDTREPTVIHIVVLFENATYIEPPKSAKSVTAQGYDLLRVK